MFSLDAQRRWPARDHTTPETEKKNWVEYEKLMVRAEHPPYQMLNLISKFGLSNSNGAAFRRPVYQSNGTAD
jgi:hypothetical protein